MIVGNEFSEKCKIILLETERVSGETGRANVSVVVLNTTLKFDRTEIKNLFQYLSDLKYIVIESIGGPYLYGDISLTEKGLLKTAAIKSD